MATVPNPKTWATNDDLGASTLNSQIRDPFNFLLDQPRCRVYNNAGISIPNGTATALTFNSERFDNDAMHSTASNTGRITFTTAGTYIVGGHVNFATSGTGLRQLFIRLNGSQLLAAQGAPDGTDFLSIATVYAFTASQYVELLVFQSSGGALDVESTAAYSPEFWAARLGA